MQKNNRYKGFHLYLQLSENSHKRTYLALEAHISPSTTKCRGVKRKALINALMSLLQRGRGISNDHVRTVKSNLILLFNTPNNGKKRDEREAWVARARTRVPVCFFRKLRVVKSHVGSKVEKGGKRLRPSPPVPV